MTNPSPTRQADFGLDSRTSYPRPIYLAIDAAVTLALSGAILVLPLLLRLVGRRSGTPPRSI